MIESNYCQFNIFLLPLVNEELLDFAMSSESQYVNATTSTNEPDFGQAKVLYEFDKFSSLIRTKIRHSFKTILYRLDVISFQIDAIEAQLTAHNHGHYFKTHTDNDGSLVANRQISYVYYFSKSPKPFDGGELELGNTRIQPTNNSIVFFGSGEYHQVLPVDCPSRQFADSRFTVNGWIRSL